jgi:4-hydroxybenzoate polyprenyltransferase
LSKDLRLNYAVVSSGLILLGFFWNNLNGFDWQYMALIVSTFCANVFGFVVNDFYDSTYDFQEDVKKTRNLFCSSNTKRLGKVVLYVSLSLSLLFSVVVSPNIFLIIVLFDFLAFFYSAPPIRLRNRLYWDWIFVFLWKGIIVFSGYFYFSGMTVPRDPFMLGALTMVLLASLINQIENQIRDFEVDKMTNTDNSVQRLGSHNASSINHILLVLFYTFSSVFCYFSGLHVTMLLSLLNVSLSYFVNPSKYGHVIKFTGIWIVALFLEHFMIYFS